MPESVLDSDIQYLAGVGPHRAEVLKKVGVATFRDLFHYYPRRYLDRSTVTPISSLGHASGPVTVVGTVRSADLIQKSRRRFQVRLDDGSGVPLQLVWFNGIGWISKLFSVGERLAVHGVAQAFGRSFSMVHPDFDRLDDEGPALDTGRIIPLYPGGQALERVGLNSRTFRRLVYQLFKKHGLAITEILPEQIRSDHGLIDGNVALRAVHLPRSPEELDAARRRLKFEEFFFLQLLLGLTRQTKRQEVAGLQFGTRGPLLRRFLDETLPFQLTGAQQRALEVILKDTSEGRQMNRLLQGDVGCGKTVVAVAALLHAVDNGYQGAFMAPTEILAEQHHSLLRRMLEPLDVQVRLLIGGQRKALRTEILEDIAQGRAHVVVGTHAVIEETVVFKNFGLAIVDEQHRFGVMQRARMFAKGVQPHMLLMTATPIPRSLAMTLYGDLDVTIIDELPAGRKPIETQVRFENQRAEVYEFVREQLRIGRQAYVVYPLVEESEKLDLKDAENGYETLLAEFRPYQVDLIHGRMLPYEKEEAMDRFKRGETDLLVATTVIEVGVDVPNASVMVVEHAERFGLSQLHQLRGRVGRGAEQSYCILMSDYKRSEEARYRLEAMAATTDGFRIAELDLKQRGAGDFFGTRQSGLPDLKIADIVQDADLLTLARKEAFALVDRDPHIRAPEHAELRSHLERTAPKGLGFARVG